MAEHTSLIDTLARWETATEGGRRIDGRWAYRLTSKIAFAAPSEAAAQRARRRIFWSRIVIRVAIAVLIAQIWLRVGLLTMVLSGPLLALLLMVMGLVLDRLWLRGWERCDASSVATPDESSRAHAVRAHLTMMGIAGGSLLLCLAAGVWLTAGPRHWLGAALAALGILIAVHFCRRLLRVIHEARTRARQA